MMEDYYYILPGRDGFKGAALDDYLASGYYRMMHMIFTTNQTALDLEGRSLPVFWLRTPVRNICENKTAAGIRKKCASFKAMYKKAVVTEEVEALYSRYHRSIKFNASSTCHNYLHEDYIKNPFDSMMVEIRNDSTLIAVGYFDLGKNAITGILNFYDPEYKKYSLGKFLILKKIDYAKASDMVYYYTGYISTETTKFDYKLFPDRRKIEVFLPVEKQWVPYELLGKEKLENYFYTYLI